MRTQEDWTTLIELWLPCIEPESQIKRLYSRGLDVKRACLYDSLEEKDKLTNDDFMQLS